MSQQSHNTFEEQWRNAFDDASLVPSESVWENIEATLDEPLPPTPDKPSGGLGRYVLGGAVVGAALLGWWLHTTSKETSPRQSVVTPQLQEKQVVVPKHSQVSTPIQYKPIPSKPFVKVVRSVPVPVQESPLPELLVEKNVIDSLSFLTPIATQQLPVTTPVQEIQPMIMTESTPYYEKKQPVASPAKKKSFLKNVRISVGAGVYQR